MEPRWTAYAVRGTPTSSVAVPPGARRIDVKGKTIMPGIIDVHAHVGQEADAQAPGLERCQIAEIQLFVRQAHEVARIRPRDMVMASTDLRAARNPVQKQQEEMRMSKDGLCAIVTGSASGLGAATAAILAKGGARIVVNYSSSREGADRIVSEILKSDGKAVAVQRPLHGAERIAWLWFAVARRAGLRAQRRIVRVSGEPAIEFIGA